MGIVWKSIDEQIREAMTCEVILQFHARSEHYTLWWKATPSSLIMEVAFNGCISSHQPQYAAINLLQKPTPHIEHFRHDLMVVVEATKNEARFWKPCFRASLSLISNIFLAVIRLVSIGQIDDLLRVKRALIFRDDASVRDDVIYTLPPLSPGNRDN